MNGLRGVHGVVAALSGYGGGIDQAAHQGEGIPSGHDEEGIVSGGHKSEGAPTGHDGEGVSGVNDSTGSRGIEAMGPQGGGDVEPAHK